MTPYSHDYRLKNNQVVTIRQPVESDTEALIDLINVLDTETRFLAREPGEFNVTPEQERATIAKVMDSHDDRWFVAECEGRLVGRCGVGAVSTRSRFRHRAEMNIGVLKEYWHLGIGSLLMQEMISWCRANGYEQLELLAVADNARGIGLYERFGFKVTGRYEHALKYSDGTYADELVMVLKL